MSSHAEIWGKPEQFDLYVKKFRSLFDMHTIQFGSPEDFPGFMTKLVQDRHFAMDFWALTGTLGRREGGELSVEQMLAVIVDGVTGGDIPADDDGHKTLVDELASLLAGVDLYGPSRQSDSDGESDGESDLPPPVSPITHAVAQARSADMTNRALEEVPLTSSVTAFIAGAVESEPGQSSSPVATVQHQLDEALMRLELNSLELKEHLDDLDKKMSRIEPHLEALTSKMNSAQRLRRPAEESINKPVEKSVRTPAENPRLVLEPLANKHDDPSIRTPLAGYSQRSGHRNVVLFVAIFAMLLVGGVVLQQRYGTSLWQGYNALIEKMHGADTGQVAANSASQNAAPNTVTGSSPTAEIANDRGNSLNPLTTPEPSSASKQTIAGHGAAAPSGEPGAVSTRYDSRSSRKKMTHSAHSETVERAAADQSSSGDDEIGTVTVAPSVMKANLVASRVPAYPEAAKADHIEGPVVVQAIISKNGVVDRVHVIEGNPRLRSAAAEAVQKWRYKPYLLNGQPVEVATTITVDFKLDR